MKRFCRRHKRPLIAWAVLATGSLALGAVLWFATTPHPAALHWVLVNLGFAASWGAPIGVWIGADELGWLIERHHDRAVARLQAAATEQQPTT